jgi:hypothetical protein
MGSKAPFRARIGHIRYCSHRYRIGALRQYMARPAKPIKLTTRQRPGDDNVSIGHDGATRSSQLTPRPKLANVRIACTLECDFYAATKRKAEANGGDFSVSFTFAIVPIDA